MNLTQIVATVPELEKVIYEKYPSTPREQAGCQVEKARLDHLRDLYAKRLYQDHKEKYEYTTRIQKSESQV
jgi:hypothetical protein